MKITELKDKILIAELKPNCDYILLVNMNLVNFKTLQYAQGAIPRIKKIPIVIVQDVEKSVRFIEIEGDK